MDKGIHRRTVIDRFAGPVRRNLASPVVLLPSAAFLAFLASAADLLWSHPLMWVAGACVGAMIAVHSYALRTPSIPGGLDVLTRAGEIVSRSSRLPAGAYASALACISIGCAAAMIVSLQHPELRAISALYVILVVPATNFVAAVWRLISVGFSVDVLLDREGVTFVAPLRRKESVGWDAIVHALAQALVSRLSLLTTSGREVSGGTRLQRTDQWVLAEIINRCAEHPIARERLGDLILGDLLLDAAPDGTEPAPPNDERRK